jgi:hypothetical protein
VVARSRSRLLSRLLGRCCFDLTNVVAGDIQTLSISALRANINSLIGAEYVLNGSLLNLFFFFLLCLGSMSYQNIKF